MKPLTEAEELRLRELVKALIAEKEAELKKLYEQSRKLATKTR